MVKKKLSKKEFDELMKKLYPDERIRESIIDFSRLAKELENCYNNPSKDADDRFDKLMDELNNKYGI